MSKEIFFTKLPVVLLLAVLVTLFWGSAFPAIKVGYRWFSIGDEDVLGKILFAGYRFFLAGFLVWAFACCTKKRIVLPGRRDWKGILLLGLIQTAVQYGFFYLGLSYTSGVRGSVTYSVNSFIAVLLAHFFCRSDKLTIKKIAGCSIGFFGVVFIHLGKGELYGSFSFAGEGMLIIAAAALASGALISRFAARESDIFTITAFQMMLGGGLLMGIGGFPAKKMVFGGGAGAGLLLYLAFSSAVSFCVWTILLKYNKVGKVAIYNFLMPIFGTLLSGLVLAEPIFNFRNLLSLLCICAGICIINYEKSGPNGSRYSA